VGIRQHTELSVSIWLISAATPGAPRISYKLREDTRGSTLRSKESGWPMPPPAPSTATLVCRAELVEKARVCVDRRRAAERVNMKEVREVEEKTWGAGRSQTDDPLKAGVSELNPNAILRPRRTTDPYSAQY
jgi:hypothetical protein